MSTWYAMNVTHISSHSYESNSNMAARLPLTSAIYVRASRPRFTSALYIRPRFASALYIRPRFASALSRLSVSATLIEVTKNNCLIKNSTRPRITVPML